jgi:hypothetical protein
MTRLTLFIGSILLSSGILAARLPPASKGVDDVQGFVREPSGMGIPAARVELRSGERVLVAVQTDGSGAFRLTTPATWSESWRLHVERLGYSPVEIAVPQGLDPIEIELVPAPLPLPGLVVTGEGDLCEAREDSMFSYQSAAETGEPWLGPQIEDVILDLVKAAYKYALVAPIGFVCDHVEILYDIDIEAKAIADEHGLQLERIESMNSTPLFIEAVADAVLEGASS